MFRFLLASTLLAFLTLPLAIHADSVAVPNTFLNGTPADADQVNANFDAVEAAVNDNGARVGSVEGGVTTNAANIASETVRAAFAESANAMNVANETTRAQAAEQVNAAAITNETTRAESAEQANAIAVTNEGIRAIDAEQVNVALIVALEARIATLEAGLGTPTDGRFQACLDGLTVADTESGLLWERKSLTGDIHDLINTFSWSSTGSTADGTAYTVFLSALNSSPGFAGHSNWRLPYISELQSIMVGPGVNTVANADPPDPVSGTNPTGQSSRFPFYPTVDPRFTEIAGLSAEDRYWSASTVASGTGDTAYVANFESTSSTSTAEKVHYNYVRAVRTGSCTD